MPNDNQVILARYKEILLQHYEEEYVPACLGEPYTYFAAFCRFNTRYSIQQPGEEKNMSLRLAAQYAYGLIASVNHCLNTKYAFHYESWFPEIKALLEQMQIKANEDLQVVSDSPPRIPTPSLFA